jgi:hypothetical protein
MATMSEVVGERQERDYKASFEGLNKWVGKEFNQVRESVTGVEGSIADLTRIVEQLVKAQAPAQEPPPAAKTEPAAPQEPPQTENRDTAVLDAMAKLEAERYRSLLIERYTQPGQPGEGLPLRTFADNIPLHPPELGEDGHVDDAAQRQAIEDFAKKLGGIKGETQQETQDAMQQGWTPGSSPALPREEESANALYEEFQKLLEQQALPEFADLPKSEQDKVESRYFELLGDPRIKERHGGNLRTGLDWDEVGSMLEELQQKVSRLEVGRPK